jgi:hypothetical protein
MLYTIFGVGNSQLYTVRHFSFEVGTTGFAVHNNHHQALLQIMDFGTVPIREGKAFALQ